MSQAAGTPSVSGLLPLPPDLNPEWSQIRQVLLCQGEPGWVPFMERGLDRSHKRHILGREVRDLDDEIEVSRRLGQPFVTFGLGLQTMDAVLSVMESTHVATEGGRPEDIGWVKGSERRWARGSAGVIASEADLAAFPWPEPEDFDFTILDEAEALLPAGFKVIVVMGKLFNLAWWLMGFNAYAYALVDQPALIAHLHAKIAEIQGGVLERALAYPSVGLLWHADDMAYRTGLMVSPAVLREHIFPVYRCFNARCHERDVLTLFHSDGNVDDVIEDVITAGFDAFNPIEPVAMDIRALKARVGGRLSLVGNVDLSYTLTRGTPEEVDAEVHDLIRDVAPGGGFALASANSIPEYVPWPNFRAMHVAWLKYGRYPIDL